MATEQVLSQQHVIDRLVEELPDWRYVDGAIERSVKCNGWRGAVLLFNGIAHLAEAAWHHPDVSVSWGVVVIRLHTHSAGGITEKDLQLAAEIERCVLWRPPQDSALDGPPDDDRWRYLDL